MSLVLTPSYTRAKLKILSLLITEMCNCSLVLLYHIYYNISYIDKIYNLTNTWYIILLTSFIWYVYYKTSISCCCDMLCIDNYNYRD